MEETPNDMNVTHLFNLYERMGEALAWKTWYECVDPDSTLRKTLRNKSLVTILKRGINKSMNSLSVYKNTNEIDSLKMEVLQAQVTRRNTVEMSIEESFRPTGLNYNPQTLIICTETHIPFDVQVCLSFGYKFLSPYTCHMKNMPYILAQLDQCINEALPVLSQLEASMDIYHILKSRSHVQNDNTINWLKFIQRRTTSFFRTNQHIFATKSDKGGHTVVMEIEDYDSKIASHIREGGYELVSHCPLRFLIKTEEELVRGLQTNKRCREVFMSLKTAFEPRTLLLPKFYGLPKIHKVGTPIRPITSTIGAPGYYLAKFFDKILGTIFARTENHIRDTFEFVGFIRKTRIDSDDILVSFDVVSMFTSIPYELVFDIIMSRSELFLKHFNIGRFLLSRILFFLLQDCMVFSVLNQTFRQRDGLPMGSCLSPTIARLVMDVIIRELFSKVPSISFIRVFVDDSIAAMKPGLAQTALNVLNEFRPGKILFTIETENELASINFLNTTLIREGTSILTRWYRKDFASGRLLNYFSAHKRATVLNTAVHFIQTTLTLSDARFFTHNKPIVEQTLRDNSFPETLIISLMNTHYTLMRPSTGTTKPTATGTFSDARKSGKFVIFPYSICGGHEIKRTIRRLKTPGVVLVDSVRNTKINSIRTRKTWTPLALRTNLILISGCQCRGRFKIDKTRRNETGAMARLRITTPNKTRCNESGHAYHGVKFRRGLYYNSQTEYLLKYTQWQYRRNLDYINSNYDTPNSRLSRLVE